MSEMSEQDKDAKKLVDIDRETRGGKKGERNLVITSDFN